MAVEIGTPAGKRRLGVVQDASSVGVQLLTYTTLEPGDHVELLIQVDGSTQVDVDGTVVRVESIRSDGPWRYRVGIDLDAPSEELAGHAASIRARQERGG